MKSQLLPHRYKKIGWILLLPAFVAGIFLMTTSNFTTGPEISTFGYFGDELLGGQTKPEIRLDNVFLIPNLVSIFFLVGGMLVMFSQEKKEDEYINQIRLKSFQSSVFINYTFLFLCILFINDIPFLRVMVINLFTIIIIYVLRFHFLIHKNSIR